MKDQIEIPPTAPELWVYATMVDLLDAPRTVRSDVVSTLGRRLENNFRLSLDIDLQPVVIRIDFRAFEAQLNLE
jgi:hypothetical protein